MNRKLSDVASTVATWLTTQELSAADTLFVCGGLMAAVIQDAWPNERDRPERIKAFLASLTELGGLLGPMIVMQEANPEDLYGDLGRS